jgi:plastocyanin
MGFQRQGRKQMKRKYLAIPIAILIMGLVVLAGCSSSTPTTTPTVPTTPKTTPSTSSPTSGGASVKIIDFAFQPSTLTVKVGEEVTWTNSGAVPHTVTADSGGFDSGQLQPGAQYKHTFSSAGTYAYHCSNHPGQMTATVVVGSGTGSTSSSTSSSSGTTTTPKTGTTTTPGY